MIIIKTSKIFVFLFSLIKMIDINTSVEWRLKKKIELLPPINKSYIFSIKKFIQQQQHRKQPTNQKFIHQQHLLPPQPPPPPPTIIAHGHLNFIMTIHSMMMIISFLKKKKKAKFESNLLSGLQFVRQITIQPLKHSK